MSEAYATGGSGEPITMRHILPEEVDGYMGKDAHKEVSIQQVIITRNHRRGQGTEGSPFRRVVQVWSIDGTLIAEKDPLAAYTVEAKPAPTARPADHLLLEVSGKLATAHADLTKLREVLLEIVDTCVLEPRGMMDTVRAALADTATVPEDTYQER